MTLSQYRFDKMIKKNTKKFDNPLDLIECLQRIKKRVLNTEIIHYSSI